MSPKQDRTQYWQQTLTHFLASGLSQVAYAKQYKISKASLHKWSKHLAIPLSSGKAASCVEQDPPLSFIEVRSPLCADPVSQAPLKLELLRAGSPIIKAELTLGWEQAASLLKALAS